MTQGLLQQAKWKQGAGKRALNERLTNAQINELERKGNLLPKREIVEQGGIQYFVDNGSPVIDGAIPNSLFSGNSMSAQVGNMIATLGTKKQSGLPLTPEEENALNYATQWAARPKIFQTDQGPMQIPGINTNFINPPAQQPQANPEVNKPFLIAPKDPLQTHDAQRVIEADEFANKLDKITPLFNAIRDDMAIYPTGKTAGVELSARQFGNVVGVGDDKVLAAGERLDKNINKLVSGNMEFLKGAMSDGEREFTRQFSLGMDTSTEGNEAHIKFLEGVTKRASQKAPLMRKYFRENNNSLDGFDRHWEEYIEANPIPFPSINNSENEEDPEYSRLKEKYLK